MRQSNDVPDHHSLGYGCMMPGVLLEYPSSGRIRVRTAFSTPLTNEHCKSMSWDRIMTSTHKWLFCISRICTWGVLRSPKRDCPPNKWVPAAKLCGGMVAIEAGPEKGVGGNIKADSHSGRQGIAGLTSPLR